MIFPQEQMPFKNALIKGTVMQIKKALINDHLPVPRVSWKFCIPAICNLPMKFAISLKGSLLFNCLICLYRQNFTTQ